MIIVFDHLSGLYVHPGNVLDVEPHAYDTTEDAESARQAILKANNNAKPDEITINPEGVCPMCECLLELCRCYDEKRLGRR